MWHERRDGNIWIASWTPPGEPAWRELDPLVMTAGDQAWVVDLSGVRILTSEAVAILIALVRNVGAANGRLCFCCAAPPVATVMRAVRLYRLAPLHDGLAAALASHPA